MAYVIAFGVGVVFFLFAVALFSSAYVARKSAAPFFPTPQGAIREMLKEVKLRPGELFYDLGAGTGRALLIAEKEFGARAVGFEISVIFYCIARMNMLVHHSHATLVAKNFFSVNMKGADVVFCFLFPPVMQKIEDKLKAELMPGARIIAYAFPLPTMVPIQTATIHGKWKMFIYEKS